MKNLNLSLVVITLILGGFNRPAVSQDGTEQQEIKRTLTAMWKAIEEGDLEAYQKFIHPDYTAFGESDTYLLEGKEQEVRSIASYLKRASGVRTEMHQPSVTVHGGTAWITYYWSDEGLLNGKRFTSRGKSTRIFVKEEGRWLCIHAHFTAVP